MGISSIMSLVLVLLVASLFISISTVGSLGDAMKQGFTDIGQTNPTMEIEDEETLAELMKVTKIRSMNEGCETIEDINDGENVYDHDDLNDQLRTDTGFYNLEGTDMWPPPCFGGESGVAREGLTGAVDIRPQTGPDENYMPGVYSREQFEITEEILIDSSTSNTWLSMNSCITQSGMGMGGVVQGDLEDYGDAIREAEEESSGGITGALSSAWSAIPLSGVPGAVAGFAWETTVGTASYYLGEDTDVTNPVIFFEDDDIEVEERANIPNVDDVCEEGMGNEMQIQLCPGDKGYVQGNREYPDTESQTSAEPVWPVMVIEESEERECGDADLEDPQDYSGETGPQWHINLPQSQQGAVSLNAANFDLREEDNMVQKPDLYDPNSNLGGHEPADDRCQLLIEAQDEGIEEALAYPTGTVFPKTENVLEVWLDNIPRDEAEEWVHGDGGTEDQDGPEEASRIYLDGADLDSNYFADDDIRDRPNDVNELRGELLCANPEDKEYAEWHMCYGESEDSSVEGYNCQGEAWDS